MTFFKTLKKNNKKSLNWRRCLLGAVVCLSLWGGNPQLATAAEATAIALEVVQKGKTTRFSAEMTEETAFSATVLKDPYRVVIDLADVGFELPKGAGRKSKGLVKQVRYGILEKGKSRIVIDTDGPVLIKHSQLIARKGKSNPRIALDLVSTTPDQLAAAEQLAAETASPEITASLPVIMPKVAPQATAQPNGGKPVIVIDPGHGGIDPGAISPSKTKEKDVVFAFAQALKEVLAASGHYDVQLTRNQDRFMTLTDRVAFTRRAGADLFIAIHADTVRGQTANGTTLYTLSDTASDEEAEALAQKENRTDIIAGVNLTDQGEAVADVLIELVQRESKNYANLFSRNALAELQGVTTMTGKPLRSAGFVVLKAPDVPSVLIELGYLSSADDEKKLKDLAWRNTMAQALSRAIGQHFSALAAAE
jgi:N-acetylmuramoyl-L-alanine amidase